ncbi:LysR family transcriptional regulator [Sphingomonas colocasiae]|uniref:LysR family transcriptional regulator n=1 Tax=Sphingomonas colocasiae TaxID=1848973 RepID=A0ABS7PVP0_9SPHN|nr:LysR family transcriptional regulator [Sphingomonas colocasiae]MBY8825273.1 LysR family transcriptional regulator [Sphingomonas colocasiae]
MIEHDDIGLVATIARTGGPVRAAAALGTHVATIYRRLHRLEDRLGLGLFEKLDGRYLPTPFAEELIAAADAMQSTLDELARKAAGHDGRLTGTLCVTTTDTVLPMLSQAIAPFIANHPELRIDIAIGNAMADMTRRAADIAVRPTSTPPETLIGRRIGAITFAVFAAPGGAEGWIGFDDSLSAVPAAVWLEERAGQALRLRVNSLWAAAQAAAAGLGRAVLPTYLARGLPIAPVEGPIDALGSDLWLLYHPDLKRTPRVRYFVRDVAPRLAKLLAG